MALAQQTLSRQQTTPLNVQTALIASTVILQVEFALSAQQVKNLLDPTVLLVMAAHSQPEPHASLAQIMDVLIVWQLLDCARHVLLVQDLIMELALAQHVIMERSFQQEEQALVFLVQATIVMHVLLPQDSVHHVLQVQDSTVETQHVPYVPMEHNFQQEDQAHVFLAQTTTAQLAFQQQDCVQPVLQVQDSTVETQLAQFALTKLNSQQEEQLPAKHAQQMDV